jgi:hypothetical protein
VERERGDHLQHFCHGAPGFIFLCLKKNKKHSGTGEGRSPSALLSRCSGLYFSLCQGL